MRFYFVYELEAFRIFLIIGTSNYRIEQDLGNVQDAIKRPNQIVTSFLL